MRQLTKLIIIIIIFFTSCVDKSHNKSETDSFEKSKKVTVVLKDSLGMVSMTLPLRFDTSFQWTNQSDCGKPCEHEQYRHQPKKLPVFKESGFYYEKPDILKNQFTIIHSGYFPFHDGMDTSKNAIKNRHFKERLITDRLCGQSVFDTIEKIGDRYYSIVHLTNYNTAKHSYSAKLAALTTIKSNEIEFDFDTTSKSVINQNDFFNNSTKFIRTIRINNGI